MGSIQILLGKTRVRRRRAIAHSQLSGTDRRGVPNFLYVTDTQRKARTVAAEFVRYREGAAFLPVVSTLSALLTMLATRHGDGRACWSAGAVALIAERLLKAEPAAWPWLAALGEPERVGRALGELAQAWDEADRPALQGRPELPRFLARLLGLLAADRARRPLGDALRHLLVALGSPGVALAQWLAGPHLVVIDDVLHPSPLRRRVLTGLARAWSTLGVHVVFSFESGRDLGGAEASRFFEYADDDVVAFPLRPFQATRAFRRSLFAALVAEGGEADIVVAGKDAVRAIEPGDDAGPEEPPDLADRLYADPISAELGDAELGDAELGDVEERGVEALPRLVRWSDPAAEVRGIAHAVKARLLAGAAPDDLWVAFPGLPGYLPLVRRIFGELGIPVEISAGRPLRARPAAEVALVAARTAAEGFPLGPLLAALASDLVQFISQKWASTLARVCRERGITEGHPRAWQAKVAELEWLTPTVDRLAAACDALAPLAEPLPAEQWRDHLAAVFTEWQLIAHAERCPEPPTRAASLVALGRVFEAVEEAARDATAVDAGAWDPLRLARLLEERLAASRLPDLDIAVRRVQVVGMLELRGIHPPWLWVGGLVADDFPARPAEDFLLSRAARVVLDRLDPSDEARYLFASTLRNALDGGHALTLSWPAARGDKPLAVSALVEDLLEIEIDGRPLRERVERGVRAPTPAGSAEVDALVGEAEAAGVDASAWRPWLRDPARLAELGEVVRARRDTDGFGAWDGILDRPPPLPESLTVPELEAYLACPSRYFHRQLLLLSAETAHDPDIARAAQGRVLNQILSGFLLSLRNNEINSFSGSELPERGQLARSLHDQAEAVFAADVRLQGLPSPLSGWHRRRWLAGLVDTKPKGLLAAWLDNEIDQALPTLLDGVEHRFGALRVGPLTLEGRMHRRDTAPGGATLLIDYTSGKAPKSEDVRAGLRVQGFLHLEAAGGEGAVVYQELRGAASLARAGWMGDSATLHALGVPEKKAVVLGAAEGARMRAHLAAAGVRLSRGVFHPSLAGPDRAGCEWCAFHTSCRVDHARATAIAAAGDSRWQAPLGDPESAAHSAGHAAAPCLTEMQGGE